MTALAVAITRDWRAGRGGGRRRRADCDELPVDPRRRATTWRRGGGAGRALLKVAGRYALLAFLAYVMIARLRLPPLGLMAGASSVVAAAVVEAVRHLLKKTKT